MDSIVKIYLDLLASMMAHPQSFFIKFFPFVLLIEMPLYALIIVGNVIAVWQRRLGRASWRGYTPAVSCIVTCYSEGWAVRKTLLTLFEQIYEGLIEVIVVVDGAVQNVQTLAAVKEFARNTAPRYSNRILRVLPKAQRGGRVSSLNSGLVFARGKIVMALDGDTSFDNDMVRMATRHFVDPDVCAVSGALMVRNSRISLATRLQRLEYMLSLLFSKTGLSTFNVVNNISGAFGVFRHSMLKQIGGWSVGTAEDLDMTIRIKQYMRRTGCAIRFDPFSIGHTDVPETWRGLLKQRLRWDGDLGYLYMRKHIMAFQPRLMGWRNFLVLLWSGFFLQIVSPFIIFCYTIALAFILPLSQWIAFNLFVMGYYFVVSLFMFFGHVLMTSRNRWQDLRQVVLVPFFGFYTYVNRLWSCVALLNEGLRRGHEESSMAPWWVLKRTKH